MKAEDAQSRKLVIAVAASLVEGIETAHEWKLERYDPVWRNPLKGKTLSVYATRRFPAPDVPGGNRWTGGREIVIEIDVEYAEPQSKPATTLDRDEVAELAAYDVADAIEAWSMSHQRMDDVEGQPFANRFDWMNTSYQPDLQREAYGRYCRVTFQGRVHVDYAD